MPIPPHTGWGFDTIVGEYCVQVGGGVVPASGVLDTSVVLARRYDLGDHVVYTHDND